MENKDSIMIPFCVYEEAQDTYEKDKERYHMIIKFLLWLLLAVFVLGIGSNLAWIAYQNSFDKTVSCSQDGKGINNVNIGEGDINNGAESSSEEEEEH